MDAPLERIGISQSDLYKKTSTKPWPILALNLNIDGFLLRRKGTPRTPIVNAYSLTLSKNPILDQTAYVPLCHDKRCGAYYG